MAITDYPLSVDEFHCIKLIDISLKVVGTKEFTPLQKNFPKSLENQAQIVLNRKFKVQEDTDHYFDHQQIRSKKVIFTDSFESCRESALMGCGVSVLPEQIIKNDIKQGHLIEIGDIPEIVLSIWLISLKSRVSESMIKNAFDYAFPQNQDELFTL